VVDVRIATLQDRDVVGRVLGEAFINDPVLRWMMPDGKRSELLFRTLARHQHGPLGSSDIAETAGRPVGASLWDPPGHHQSPWQAIASAVPFTRALRTRTHYGSVLESTFHKHRPPGTFWYLALIGAIDPGNGIGSALLEHRLARIEGPAYLESSNEANVPLYERFGFVVTGEIHLPFHGPTCWKMYRAS
jgi:ribosomal protein S18 acetylase RimI-like enzyme